MLNLCRKLHVFLSDSKGATAIEYSILIGGIALSIVLVLMLVGDEIAEIISTIGTEFSDSVDNIEP